MGPIFNPVYWMFCCIPMLLGIGLFSMAPIVLYSTRSMSRRAAIITRWIIAFILLSFVIIMGYALYFVFPLLLNTSIAD
jgi:hypothetical protein